MNEWMKRRLFPVLFCLITCMSLSLPAHADERAFVWARLDTEVEVLPNGDLRVTETNVIEFTAGTFHWGYRDIELNRITGVRDVEVTEGGRSLRVDVVEGESGIVRIKYYFSRPARFERRTFKLRYTVSGALRYYPEGDQLFWVAVYADRAGFPVQAARVTVRLPADATVQKAEIYGVRANLRGLGGNVLVGEAQEPIPSGSEMEVRVQFPHGIVKGEPPPWQREFDERRHFEEFEKPIYNAIALLLSALILCGGLTTVFVLYYVGGRDPQVSWAAEHITSPPPELPPAIAGALVDETVDDQDITAVVIDLARRGVLKIRECQSEGDDQDWAIELGPCYGEVTLQPYERLLITALGVIRGVRTFSEVRRWFYIRVPDIQSAIYHVLVRDGYYMHRPDQTRNRYEKLAKIIMAASLIVIVPVIRLAMSWTEFSIAPPIAAFVVGAALYFVGQHMPIRTRKGAEMRKRAEAFRRYLADIERYTELRESKDLFDRYLPYAIAFGLERQWVNKFAAIVGPPLSWYGVTAGHNTASEGRSSAHQLPSIDGQARADQGFVGVERSIGQGINQLSNRLSSLFDSIGETIGGGDGGGWSGGGSRGGGGSGGGGGGFG